MKTPSEFASTDKIKGLTAKDVFESRSKFGRNEITNIKHTFFSTFLELLKEPMLLLLLLASTLYFISGSIGDGFFMLFAIVLITGISLYQESRSRSALAALRSLTQPTCTVIRDGQTMSIAKEEIVVGDFMFVTEGNAVSADAVIIQSNDFTVNESILTGESLPVNKSSENNINLIYQGTTVSSGLAIARVQTIGPLTALAKIGKSLEDIIEEETPLQHQIKNFVKKMALIGGAIFFIVWTLHFLKSYNLFGSLLQALTLAMSILPEEIPVAFTTFMALGAWRLMKLGVIVKNISTVEALGSATVICTDKTGTITENRMTLAKVYALSSGNSVDPTDAGVKEKEVITLAMWASEPIPFDPMEIALHKAYSTITSTGERNSFKMIHEYPLDGRPPMMTHIFENANGQRIIAAKGAPEAMISEAKLSSSQKEEILTATIAFAASGYRVLGVGVSDFQGNNFPEKQQQLPFVFKGLVAFYDPPKSNIKKVLETFYEAGINVKIITGDNAETTVNIARQINFKGYETTLSGEELVRMNDTDLQKRVSEVNIFSRMFPEAKLKIINALKSNGQVVAMIGDGVNDSPALKAAHISIAMGRKGTEIAKEVSSLVLADDDLSKLVDAIALGRKIYSNLKKAIQYIISIHIPIILTVFLPLVFGWVYPAILTPIHVIFLELIMGPTCSIIYENEPLEKNAMLQKPRPSRSTFFRWRELRTSITQGLMITLGTLLIYQYAVFHNFDEDLTRTMVFVTLLVANIFLTLVNRSFHYSLFTTMRYHNRLVPLIIAITIGFGFLMLSIAPIREFFQFEILSVSNLLISISIGCLSVVWFDLVKALNKSNRNQ